MVLGSGNRYAGHHAGKRSPHPAGSVQPIDTTAPEYLDFMARVFDAAIADRVRRGKKQFSDIPSGELAEVENGKVMRKEAAARCIQLLKDARESLGGDRWGPPPSLEAMAAATQARNVRSIGIASAYRSHAYERRIWAQDCFPKYYKETYARRLDAAGGPHGDAAVQLLVRYFSPRKAPPGFSNHSNGKAVDFTTREGKVTFTANTSQRAGWRKTWLHAWLVTNAPKYGFHPLASEEWHWDYD